jgi:hypothetical protein
LVLAPFSSRALLRAKQTIFTGTRFNDRFSWLTFVSVISLPKQTIVVFSPFFYRA